MDRGYICLWRKTIESEVFHNEGLFKVWVWCLMKANHKEAYVPMKTGRGETTVKVLPGQFIFGRYSAARELHTEPSTLWQRLKKLKSTQNIDIESNSKYSIISIINWGIYQAQKNNCDSEKDRQKTGKRQPSDTNNNDNNEKNKYKPLSSPEETCPHQGIIQAYHEILPELPAVRIWSEKRKAALRARWRESVNRQSVEWWRGFFEYVRGSDFLMGRVASKGRSPFRADLEWMVTQNNFIKIVEGKYHRA